MKALLLAAGFGKRLRPVTNEIPKCLVLIKDKPLLEYWLEELQRINIDKIVVNTHYLSEQVDNYISHSEVALKLLQDRRLEVRYEPVLLGTAATVRENYDVLKGDKLLLIHADNWCRCSISEFINYHNNERPEKTVMTMMTFKTESPSQCGIIEIDKQGVLVDFHEKVENPPSDLANGAVYMLEPEVVALISQQSEVVDISTQLIPKFIGKIATWENKGIHRDIGTVEMLKLAQND